MVCIIQNWCIPIITVRHVYWIMTAGNLDTEHFCQFVAGQHIPENCQPVAAIYVIGHQFGGLVPQLGRWTGITPLVMAEVLQQILVQNTGKSKA